MKSLRHQLSVMICLLLASSVGIAAESREAVIERVGSDIKFLASDALEGRGVETRGIHLAADHILEEYKKYGLKPGMPDGTFKQAFNVAPETAAINSDTQAVLIDADGVETALKLTTEFQPMQRGVNGRGGGELHFIGYGISSPNDHYDEYAGQDIEGKVLVMIRREPQQKVPNGAFLGPETSSHAYINRKLQLAVQHRAAGVIFVNDIATTAGSKSDDLSPPHGFGRAPSGIPFIHVKQSVVDRILQANPLKAAVEGTEQMLDSLEAVCEHIDKNLTPLSQPIPGQLAKLTTKFDSGMVEAFNLIGVLEGEGDLADETIVVGAHYDHIGYGGRASKSPQRNGEIHNGADDNATGTAAVLEMVRRMTAGPKPKRRIVFICFSGEERGLLGSNHYVSSPVFPLEKTVAMLNYDMIGTLRNNLVTVNGVGTAEEFRAIAIAADEASPLDTTMVEHPFAGSDHLPFFNKQIPVMFCFTGLTDRYHTPDDDYERINVEGVVAVTEYTESLLRGIDALPTAPTFMAVNRRSRPRKIPHLGVVPNLAADADEPGVPIQSVRGGGPAEAAGMQVGDILRQANETKLDSYNDLIEFLRKAKEGTKVELKVQRGDDEVVLPVTLGPAR